MTEFMNTDLGTLVYMVVSVIIGGYCILKLLNVIYKRIKQEKDPFRRDMTVFAGMFCSVCIGFVFVVLYFVLRHG